MEEVKEVATVLPAEKVLQPGGESGSLGAGRRWRDGRTGRARPAEPTRPRGRPGCPPRAARGLPCPGGPALLSSPPPPVTFLACFFNYTRGFFPVAITPAQERPAVFLISVPEAFAVVIGHSVVPGRE